MGHTHHKMSTDRRTTFYAEQERNGNLQILCRTCHEEKSKKENPRRIIDEIPLSKGEGTVRDGFCRNCGEPLIASDHGFDGFCVSCAEAELKTHRREMAERRARLNTQEI